MMLRSIPGPLVACLLVASPGSAAPRAEEGAKGTAAETPKPVAGPSLWFCLRPGPSGQLHLLTYEFGKSRFALRVRGESGFGPPRYVQSPHAPNEDPAWFDLQVGPDGSAHIFILRSEGKDPADYRFAHLPAEKADKKKSPRVQGDALKPAWVQLAADPASRDSWSQPHILPQKNGSLEILSQVLRTRGSGPQRTLESRRLVRGLLQRGRFRVTGSIDLDKGAFQGLMSPRFFSLPDGQPVALFLGKGGMTWTTLKQFQPVFAFQAPERGVLEYGTLAVLTRSGEVHVALPESIDEGKGEAKETRESGWRYKIYRGQPLAALQALGPIPAMFSLPNAVLAALPDGRVWLFGVSGSTQDPLRVKAWELSGKFPPQAVSIPWTAHPHLIQAACAGDHKVALAFATEEGICVEEADLPPAP